MYVKEEEEKEQQEEKLEINNNGICRMGNKAELLHRSDILCNHNKIMRLGVDLKQIGQGSSLDLQVLD